ncbi:MAG: MTAP family purine nucleoside phosphorylase [Candidatus Margulisbacteria bacterium]|nr:MTAP family purine nucleoside phosphorylase [Candidatus Margulisiibacteriota bacterium]MBU1022506.1 MTAP family purine nucleoside phosphorylase [Candidatus Margulisiibacteriota bacterium]MBU1728490.1 MTAP family purine nucleoside phosphorylase [Candidatus Margulisiibacteriota bacterium]MBU1954637.1 MTAP family purine nucleoside phosphorylase [Candidatus Margulisiibacteriota bacterium]
MKRKSKIGIIGSSGYGDLPFLINEKVNRVFTPHGFTKLKQGFVDAVPVVFLPRHDFSLSIAPHKINYRANIAALRKLEVDMIIAINAVGSMNNGLRPGSLGIVSDFIDATKSRASTYYDKGQPVHIDMSEPYSPAVNKLIIQAAKNAGVSLKKDLVYVCTEGPRFETKSEIQMYKKLGADVVGMSAVPEVVLAAEVGMPYASLCMATNMAAGLEKGRLSVEEMTKTIEKNRNKITKVLREVIRIVRAT